MKEEKKKEDIKNLFESYDEGMWLPWVGIVVILIAMVLLGRA